MAIVCKLECKFCIPTTDAKVKPNQLGSNGLILKFDSGEESTLLIDNSEERTDQDRSTAASVISFPMDDSSKHSVDSTLSDSVTSPRIRKYYDNTMTPASEHRLAIMNKYFADTLAAIEPTQQGQEAGEAEDIIKQLNFDRESNKSWDDSFASFRTLSLEEQQQLIDNKNNPHLQDQQAGVPSCSAGLYRASMSVASLPQSITPTVGNNAPLRQFRLLQRSKAQLEAQRQNKINCSPTKAIVAKGIGRLLVEIGEARNITWNNTPIEYSFFCPRTFNCILNMTHLPPNCNQKAFHHQTTYQLMNKATHTVQWKEAFSIGPLFDLKSVLKIRLVLDTTLLAMGKTTKFGTCDICIQDLYQHRLAHKRVISDWFQVSCETASAELFLKFVLENRDDLDLDLEDEIVFKSNEISTPDIAFNSCNTAAAVETESERIVIGKEKTN